MAIDVVADWRQCCTFSVISTHDKTGRANACGLAKRETVNARYATLGLFELIGIELMTRKQFVKVRSVTFCESCSLADVAGSDL